MIDESLLSELKIIGLSEYEAKVYVILIALRFASALDVHEQTKIPRGRIYETLSSLTRKGLILSSGNSPVRYAPVDITHTFDRLKRESVESLESLSRRLKDLETDTPQPLMQGHKLLTEWTRDNQIRMMLRRAKSEIILLCNDNDMISRYKIDIINASKRILLFLIVDSRELLETLPVSGHVGGKDIEISLLHPDQGEKNGLELKLLLISDRRESLSIMDDNGILTGIVISPDVFAHYLSRKIIDEIQTIPKDS